MDTIDFIFFYIEEDEKFILNKLLSFIKEDVNGNGGISGKPIDFHLMETGTIDDESIIKSFPKAIFIQGDEFFEDLDSYLSDQYCLFFPNNRISKKLHKNVISLGNYLCSDEIAIEKLLVPSHSVNKLWFFSNSDEYKSWDETPPQFPEDIFIETENQEFLDKVEIISYNNQVKNYCEKSIKIPSSILNAIEKIKEDDLIIFNASHADMLIALVAKSFAEKNQQQKIVLINDSPDIDFINMFVSLVGMESLNNLELISFSKNNDDLYLRMEEFIEKLNFDWDAFNKAFPIDATNFISSQKNKINSLFIEKGLEIIYLIKNSSDEYKINYENKKDFIETVLWGISRYDGINNKYLGLSANYSFIGNVNIEPSHFTYRTVSSSQDSSEYINLLTSRLSSNFKRTVGEVKKDEEQFEKIEDFIFSTENEYFKLFHNVQLRTDLQPRELLNEFESIEDISSQDDEIFEGFGEVLKNNHENNLLISDINYVYFDILNISRISIEDKNWSVEFYLDLITKHDLGIEILQFDNLSKKDSLFETNLISKEVDVENKDLTNFRYRISANFDFDAMPNNYPFDEQYLSISYSSSNTEKFGSIHPVPVRKIDKNFQLEGWDLLTVNAGISRTIDKKSVGSSLLQNANVKEVAKIGWKIKRGSSMTLFKILLPLSFLLALTYYSIFVPLAELGDSISILTTVFLASIALYFSTERPQPLSMTIVDLIFASFYSITGITIIFTILVHLFNPLALFLLTPLKVLLPLSFVGLGIFIYRRIKSKRFSPSLTSD